MINSRQLFWFTTNVFEFIKCHPQHINDLVKASTLLPGILHYLYFTAK